MIFPVIKEKIITALSLPQTLCLHAIMCVTYSLLLNPCLRTLLRPARALLCRSRYVTAQSLSLKLYQADFPFREGLVFVHTFVYY